MENAVHRPTQLSHDRCFHRYYEEVGRTEMLAPAIEYTFATRYVKSREAIKTQKELLAELKESGNAIESKKASRKLKRMKLDIQARDKLIHNCLRSVVKIAAQFSHNPDLIKDLISAGNLGVFHALDKYELNKNTRFLSYATYWIQFYIREELDKVDLVSMPRWRQKAIRKIRQVNTHYIAREGRDAEDEEICEKTELSPAQLSRLQQVTRLRFSAVANLLHRHNTTTSDDQETFKQTLNQETKSALAQCLKVLGPKHNFVVRAYFGMVTDPMSLHQIAKIICVSSERVRQVKVEALRRLHKVVCQGLKITSVDELCF